MNFDILSIGKVFSNLQSISYLTSGGQKSVYSAKHPKFGDIVLKIFESGSELERIEREVRAMEIMKLKSTPTIYESGEVDLKDEKIFYFMEQRISGVTLSEKIKLVGAMPGEVVIDYACQLLEILAEAESKDIVHRDIKPSNIMIDDDNVLWLFDYGIARHLDMDSLTNTSNILGASTPGYAPIEQFKNRKGDINSRSDLFAVGVTMYECLTGSNPYYLDAKGPLDVLDKVENERLPRLSKISGSGEIEDFVYDLTQPSQEHRPVSAKDAFDWASEIKEGW